jgi:hypothetical protein
MLFWNHLKNPLAALDFSRSGAVSGNVYGYDSFMDGTAYDFLKLCVIYICMSSYSKVIIRIGSHILCVSVYKRCYYYVF